MSLEMIQESGTKKEYEGVLENIANKNKIIHEGQ